MYNSSLCAPMGNANAHCYLNQDFTDGHALNCEYCGITVTNSELHPIRLGYRFAPKDHELIVHYLNKRIEAGQYHHQVFVPKELDRIRDVHTDPFLYNPPTLLGKYGLDLKRVWYFISTLSKEHVKDDIGSRLATRIDVDEGGYWKFVMSTKVVSPRALANTTIVGHKMFYRFHQPVIDIPGTNPTQWVMLLHTSIPKPEIDANTLGDRTVMCKIFNIGSVGKRQHCIKMSDPLDQTLEELQKFDDKRRVERQLEELRNCEYCVNMESEIGPAKLGYRFMPKDNELIIYYLNKRIEEGHHQNVTPKELDRIRDVQADVFIYTPPNLLQKYELDVKEVWYFLSTLKREYIEDETHSRLADRIAVDQGGYWKSITSRRVYDRDAFVDVGQIVSVGHKTIYQFHQPMVGSETGHVSTQWLMVLHVSHPRRGVSPASDTNTLGGQIVMCKIFNIDNVEKRKNCLTCLIPNEQTLLELGMFQGAELDDRLRASLVPAI